MNYFVVHPGHVTVTPADTCQVTLTTSQPHLPIFSKILFIPALLFETMLIVIVIYTMQIQ